MKVIQAHKPLKETNTVSGQSTEPWLNNPSWENNRILSSNKSMVYPVVFFALFWNAFSYGMVYFMLADAYQDSGISVALLILLFPAVGLWLFYIAFKGVKERYTFGVTPLEMMPFPGVIGGNVGGRIPFRKRLDNRYDYHVTLTLIRERISRSKKKSHDSLIWQTNGIATLKQVLTEKVKSELHFRFEVPDNLAESGITLLPEQQTEQYLWQVTIENKETGLERSFEIPVYDVTNQTTASKNKYASIFDTSETSAEIKTKRDTQATIEDFLPFQKNTENHRAGFNQHTIVIHHPIFRKPFINLFLIALGSLFFMIGIFGWAEKDASFIFTLIFCLLGGFIVLTAFHSLGSSLTITLNNSSLEAEQKLFGFSVRKKHVNFSAIQEIKSKISYRSRLGNKYITHYNILAVINNSKIKLADAESETARQVLLAYFRDKIFE